MAIDVKITSVGSFSINSTEFAGIAKDKVVAAPTEVEIFTVETPAVLLNKRTQVEALMLVADPALVSV
jgi:hypothetical protein